MKATLTHPIFTIGSGPVGTGVRLIPGEYDRWECFIWQGRAIWRSFIRQEAEPDDLGRDFVKHPDLWVCVFIKSN
jgi:hypothetical protein